MDLPVRIREGIAIPDLQHVVYAKVRKTGDYRLAGWSAGLTREAADALSHGSSPGDIALSEGDVALSSLVTEDGTRLVALAMPGGWKDAAGRPWLYRHLALVPANDFDGLHCDPFLLQRALVRQEEFDTGSEDLPVLNASVPSESAIAELHDQRRRWARADARFPSALESALSGANVSWQCGSDVLPLLAGIIAVLPRRARSALTFVSQAVQRSKFDAVIFVAPRPIPGLAEGRATPLNLHARSPEGLQAQSSDAATRAIVDWLASDTAGALGRWHLVADRFLADISTTAPWATVADAVLRSASWFARLEQKTAETSEEVDGILRWADQTSLRPPADEVSALVAKVQLPELGTFESALRVVRVAASEDAGHAISAHVGAAWAKARRDPTEWVGFLDRAAAQDPMLPAIIVDAAARVFASSNGHDELLRICLSAPANRPWARSWANAVASTYQRSNAAPWDRQRVFEAVFRPLDDHWEIPPWSWVRDFAQTLAIPGGDPAGQAVADLGSPGALAGLARSSFGAVGATELAEDLLLWALVAPDSPVKPDEVAHAAREAFAQAAPIGTDASSWISSRSLRRTLTRLLLADGARVPFPVLTTAQREHLPELLAMLGALDGARSRHDIKSALLFVAASTLTHRASVSAEPAALRIVAEHRRLVEPTQMMPEAVMRVLLESASHPGHSPETRGSLLWDTLASASEKVNSASEVSKLVEKLVNQDVSTAGWPRSAAGGQPLLSLDCVEGLVISGTGRQCSNTWPDVLAAAAERLGHERRERGAKRATELVSAGLTLLGALCEAQGARGGNPLPVTRVLKASVQENLFPSRIMRAIKRSLPVRKKRTLRLQRKDGWK